MDFNDVEDMTPEQRALIEGTGPTEQQIMDQLMRQQGMMPQQYQPQYQPQQPQYQQQHFAPQNQQMSELERRLQRAQYYKLILNEWLFAEDFGDTAQEVMGELREFINDRLNVLMGMKPEQQPPQFDEQEVYALKKLASTVLQRASGIPSAPQLAQQAVKRQQPTLKKVGATQQQAPQQRQQPRAQPPMQQAHEVGQPKKFVSAAQGAPQYQQQPMQYQQPQYYQQPPQGNPEPKPFPTGAELAAATAGVAASTLKVGKAKNDPIVATAAEALGMG